MAWAVPELLKVLLELLAGIDLWTDTPPGCALKPSPAVAGVWPRAPAAPGGGLGEALSACHIWD